MDKYSNHYHIGENATEDVNPLIYDEDYYLVSDVDTKIDELNKYISDLEDMVSTEELVAYHKWKEKHEGAE